MGNIKLSSPFLLVFLTVLSITLLSGGTSLWLASKPRLSEYQVRNLEDSRATWQMGIGCIFGLLGSKATDLLESEENEDHQEK
jgi:hypothetical protein